MSVNPRATNVLTPTADRELFSARVSFRERQIAVDTRNRSFNDNRTHRLYSRTNTVVRISPADIIKRRTLSWHGVRAEAVHITKHHRVESYFRGSAHLLVLFEYGSRSKGSTFVEGMPRSALRDFERKFIFVPAGHEFYDLQEPLRLARLAYFYFDPEALPVEADLERTRSLSPRLFFEDEELWEQAIKLKTLLDRPHAFDRDYGEALGVVLAHELLRLNDAARSVETPLRGGLAAWQQRVVVEYIGEHLAEYIPLSTLAQLVRLSLFHFCRSFKQSFGTPPHRFLTQRRIERAKSLLEKRAISVSDVGTAIGFSETSSFTAAFRKATGVTPSSYQRSVTQACTIHPKSSRGL
jgi:AraC family transcriptional regulator